MPTVPNVPDPVFAAPPPVERNWKPLAGGVIAVAAIVIVLLIVFAPKPSPPRAARASEPSALAPYAANLPLTGEKMSTAEIPISGGKIYYIEGQVKNTGNQTVTGATVEILFRDSLGTICQRVDLPFKVVVATEPAPDATELSSVPLAPGQSRDFQLAIDDRISNDWNGQYPELRIVQVSSR